MIDFLTKPSSSDDIAYSWLLALFPLGADTPYGQAFAVFTAALTFLGALFMGWHIMVGIVSSAYSGKVLGERYHQIWAPLRVVLGFGMLIPVAGGFSSVHYLLRDVVGVAAIQMGNAPIKAYISGALKIPPEVSVTSVQGREIAKKIFDMQVCAAVVEGMNKYGDLTNAYLAKVQIKPTGENKNLPILGTEGKFTFAMWNFGDCGNVVFQKPGEYPGEFMADADRELLEFHEVRMKATDELVQKLAAKNVLFDADSFGKYFANKSFDAEVSQTHARELIRDSIVSEQVNEKIAQYGDEWSRKVADAATVVFAKAAKNTATKIIERIDKYGFMAAGSYERTLSQVSSVVVTLANEPMSGSVSNPGWLRYTDAYKAGLAAITAVRKEVSAKSVATATTTGDEALDVSNKVLAAISPAMVHMKLSIESTDPVGDMIMFGQNLLAYANAAILALMALSGASEGVSNSAAAWVGFGVISGIMSYVLQWANYIVMIMIIVGIMHAFVFPMLPMIMVFVMGVSWLIMFLEAAIAGVMWAFAFIRMDGQEFFDRNQSPGVSLLFNLFLRPAIGMLAFIGGILLLPKLLNALTIVWNDSFTIQTAGGSWIGIWQWAAGLIIFTWMQWHLSLRLYGLIPTIADRVGYWMGMQTHGYNDGQETTAAAGAMIAAGAAISKAPVVPQGRPGGGGGGRGGGGGGGVGADKPSVSKSKVQEMAGNKLDPGKSRRTRP